jgi:hypothetical protein
MIVIKRRNALTPLTLLVAVLCLMACTAASSATDAGDSSPTKGTATLSTTSPPLEGGTSAGKSKDISRKGNLIVVSKRLAEEVKKNNDVILSTVAIKSRVDKNGQLQGFQLFQVDRGSVVEKMGFRAKDVLTSVNGIEARGLEKNRETLEKADRFDATILRNGKERRVRILIR